MLSLRKWFYKPKKCDSALLAKFYYADEDLNIVASELDSFDGRKDPERCTLLVNQLRACQDKVLNVIQTIMDEAIPNNRANRDFRAKFPDDVVQENLSGQLWFGAECLAAGSSIMNREPESGSMRPLARALTRTLDNLRAMLREQSLRNVNHYSNIIKEALIMFDQLFAEFEFSYVSAMVPVKTFKDYEMMQDVIVLFSETIQRAIKKKFLCQDMIEDCDPALMFTIPRLAIVGGLFIFPNGPICPDLPPPDIPEMFRPFQNLLSKIRQLLKTLSDEELHALEKTLCNVDEPVTMTSDLLASPVHQCVEMEHHNAECSSSNCIQTQAIVENYYMSQSESKQTIIACSDCPEAGTSATTNVECCDNMMDLENVAQCACESFSLNSVESQQSFRTQTDDSSMLSEKGVIPSGEVDQMTQFECDGASCSKANDSSINSAESNVNCDKILVDSFLENEQNLVSDLGAFVDMEGNEDIDDSLCDVESNHSVGEVSPADYNRGFSEIEIDTDNVSSIPIKCDIYENCERELPACNYLMTAEREEIDDMPGKTPESPCSSSDKDDCISLNSTDTSSYNSECQDEEEIEMAIKAAEMASQYEARARFHSSDDLIHRLFVCIAGVADQLQTNYASDLRNILRVVFEMHSSDEMIQSPAKSPKPSPGAVRTPRYAYRPNGRRLVQEPPAWVPDEVCQSCSACKELFTIVRRRHHCRNCGKIFCSRCSSNFVPLPHYGHMKPVRVCNHCFMYQCTPFTNNLRRS